MDAWDIFQKIQKCWVELVPKNSGDIIKDKQKIKVIVLTDDGYREVVNVRINGNMIELELDNE
jgi:hypothetical protein